MSGADAAATVPGVDAAAGRTAGNIMYENHDCKNMEIVLPKPVADAIGLLESAGFEAWVVGGAVRDALLAGAAGEGSGTDGKGYAAAAPQDWDLTTDASPDDMLRVFAGCRVIETGLKHGTLTVLIDGMPLEITTFRVDGAYTDSRRPDSVSFTKNLEEDLARRDFTVNAMAYTPSLGLCDPYGGREDLAAGILRAVGKPDVPGEPVRRFREDALRILRALRFAAQHGMAVDEETKAALFSEKERLLNISPERVREEIDKLLQGDFAAAVLIDYAPIIGVVIPEMLPCVGFDQHTPYHKYDVWGHCAHAAGFARLSVPTAMALQEKVVADPALQQAAREAIGQAQAAESANGADAGVQTTGMKVADLEEPGRLILQCAWMADLAQSVSCLKWAALLHDIEKPACFFQTEDGNGHFYGHAEKSAKTADRILARLHFDNARRDKIRMLIENHDRQFVLDVKPVKRAIRKFGKQDLLLLMDLYSADVSAQSELARDRLRSHDIMRAAVTELSKEKEAAFSLRDLAVDGHDMLAIGYDGKAVGEILETLLDAVVEGELPNDKESLLARAKSLFSGGGC